MIMQTQFRAETARNAKESETKVSVKYFPIKNELGNEAQHDLYSFPIDELEEATVKVENWSAANEAVLAHTVKSEFLEFHNNESSDDINHSDMQTVTLEKIPKTEPKILGDDPPFSSDEKGSNYQNDTYCDSDSDSDPERDPFADIDCDPNFFQTLHSSPTQDVVTDVIPSSSPSKILPTTFVQLASTLQCQLCCRIQSSEKQLQIHLKSCPLPHTDKRGRRRFCVLCNKLYAYASDYRKHAFKKHGILELHSKPFKCDICGKSFGNKRSLTTHSVLHQQQQGNAAGGTVGQDNNLKDKPFKCPQCPSGFTYKGSLTRHSKSCSSNTKEPFKCPMPNCENTFVTKRSRNAHLSSVHNDVSLFKCQEPNCRKKFKTEKYVRDHFLSVHKRPYECREPGFSAAFPRPHLLSSHVQHIHRDNIQKKHKRNHPNSVFNGNNSSLWE